MPVSVSFSCSFLLVSKKDSTPKPVNWSMLRRTMKTSQDHFAALQFKNNAQIRSFEWKSPMKLLFDVISFHFKKNFQNKIIRLFCIENENSVYCFFIIFRLTLFPSALNQSHNRTKNKQTNETICNHQFQWQDKKRSLCSSIK